MCGLSKDTSERNGRGNAQTDRRTNGLHKIKSSYLDQGETMNHVSTLTSIKSCRTDEQIAQNQEFLLGPRVVAQTNGLPKIKSSYLDQRKTMNNVSTLSPIKSCRTDGRIAKNQERSYLDQRETMKHVSTLTSIKSSRTDERIAQNQEFLLGPKENHVPCFNSLSYQELSYRRTDCQKSRVLTWTKGKPCTMFQLSLLSRVIAQTNGLPKIKSSYLDQGETMYHVSTLSSTKSYRTDGQTGGQIHDIMKALSGKPSIRGNK
ncbi:hypothetical protein J6590_008740 [Homalodisca vitripennis]|nr:hypothetical protein J6590_008740 [Homalodisca vitripennis]